MSGGGNKPVTSRQSNTSTEKPAYQPRGPRPDYASMAANTASNKQPETGFINKFAHLKLDVEDVDDHDDDVGDEDEAEDEDQEKHQPVEA